MTVESLVIELPFIWTLLDTLGSSPSLGSFWALLVDESWGDLLTSILSVVVFTSLESWFQVEITTEDISLCSAFELTEPEHHLVDVGGEGQIRWIDKFEWGDSLDQDTLWSLGEHLEDESVLTVLLLTDTVSNIIDESWFTGLLLTLVGLWIVGKGLILTFLLLAHLSSLVISVRFVFTSHVNTLLNSLDPNVISIWTSFLQTFVGLLVVSVSFWALELDTFVSSSLSLREWWA